MYWSTRWAYEPRPAHDKGATMEVMDAQEIQLHPCDYRRPWNGSLELGIALWDECHLQ